LNENIGTKELNEKLGLQMQDLLRM